MTTTKRKILTLVETYFQARAALDEQVYRHGVTANVQKAEAEARQELTKLIESELHGQDESVRKGNSSGT